MTPERWRRIERLVEATLELKSTDRKRFLDAECGSDDNRNNGGDYEDVQGLTTARRRMCWGWC